jgi:hypothetical protein
VGEAATHSPTPIVRPRLLALRGVQPGYYWCRGSLGGGLSLNATGEEVRFVCNHVELRVYGPSPVSIKHKNDLNDRSDHVSRANKLKCLDLKNKMMKHVHIKPEHLQIK